MKAVIEFNLPEESLEFEMFSNAANAHQCLLEIEQYLRSESKYSDLTEQEWDKIEKVREQFYLILSNNNIRI